jgi:tripartite-type tricarboxylate transporter receptor subunit TctC
MNTFASLVMLGCAVLVARMPARAADLYPSRPIRIVVAYTPAGATDILARVPKSSRTPMLSSNKR